MLLRVTNLVKDFSTREGRVRVLDGASLTLGEKETVALTGESGSGKSTLLHLIAGLESADDGDIFIQGQSILSLDEAGRARLRRGVVAVVFQQFNLIPSLPLYDNAAFLARLSGRYDAGETSALLQRLGLSSHAEKYPEELSGGQQQRVAIARALLAKPALLLADEPTGNLDEATAETVTDELFSIVRERRAALLLVTHSSKLAEKADRSLRLSHGRVG